KRHGNEDGSVTLGGRRTKVRRPRIRTADDTQELPLRTYEHFADRDPLTRAVMDRMLAGVSTRRFARAGEPGGEEVEAEATSTSKSSVSGMFRERTATALSERMSRRGGSPTPSSPASGSSCSRASSIAVGRMLPPHCGRAWTRP